MTYSKHSNLSSIYSLDELQKELEEKSGSQLKLKKLGPNLYQFYEQVISLKLEEGRILSKLIQSPLTSIVSPQNDERYQEFIDYLMQQGVLQEVY